MSLGLPPEWAAYSAIISVVILFLDGLFFGIAVKKGIVAAILLIIALVLSGYVSLSVQYLSLSDIMTHLLNIGLSLYSHLGLFLVTFPIFFILGLGIGLWRG